MANFPSVQSDRHSKNSEFSRAGSRKRSHSGINFETDDWISSDDDQNEKWSSASYGSGPSAPFSFRRVPVPKTRKSGVSSRPEGTSFGRQWKKNKTRVQPTQKRNKSATGIEKIDASEVKRIRKKLKESSERQESYERRGAFVQDLDCEETKISRIDKSEFLRKTEKSSSTKIGSHFPATYNYAGDDVEDDDCEVLRINRSEVVRKKETSLTNAGKSVDTKGKKACSVESFSPKDVGRSYQAWQIRSSSSGSDSDAEIEKIDEVDFKTRVNVKRKQKDAPVYSSTTSDDEASEEDPSHDDNNSFSMNTISYSGSHSGVASRTRSKMRTGKQQCKTAPVAALEDSDSSSTDSGFRSVADGDGDFKLENDCSSSSNDIEFLYSLGAYESPKSVEKNEDHDKLGKCSVDRVSKSKNDEKLSPRRMPLVDDASSKQTEGGKTCEEKEGGTNRIAVDANKDVGDASSKQTKKGKTYAEEEETNRVAVDENEDVGDASSKQGKTYEDEEVDTNRIAVDETNMNPNNQSQTGVTSQEKQVSPPNYDFCRMLADSVLERAQTDQTNGSDEPKQDDVPETQDTLPLRFRFEDEVPKEIEKSECEKEVENLFAELEFNWALGSFYHANFDQQNAEPSAEETQHDRCVRGHHELVLIEDEGLICVFCHHTALQPKDILPEWVEKVRFESQRKRLIDTEKLPDFDGLHVQSSEDNCVDFSSSVGSTVWSINPCVRESLYEHQQEGFEFLWKNLAGSTDTEELKSMNAAGVGGCIISHAPGTGKTRLTIVFIESYLKLFPNCRPVIVAPASMLLTWEEEFKKWNIEFPFHNLNNLEFGLESKTALKLLANAKLQNKDAIRMVKIYMWSAGRSILGISYSLFEKLTAQKNVKEKTSVKTPKTMVEDKTNDLRRILLEIPGLVILDEGHTPRNHRSNIWNALLQLKTEKRVILSGTPFQNNFAELFNTLRIVRPTVANALALEKTFAEMITTRRTSVGPGKHYRTSESTAELDRAVEKLKISMSPFVHVHKGTILQKNLPGLRDSVILLKPPALQKSLIDRLEGSSSTKSFKFEHAVALISVHPYLFQHCCDSPDIEVDMNVVLASKLNPNEGIKTKFILELVRLSIILNEKVLIFSQYILPLELIKEQLKEIFNWVEGKHILQMQGKLDQKQRQSLINAFNNSESESKIMLATTRCCSEGISLVGASRVILLDVVWNPSVERQAISRAYRIGQRKFVYTYHLMTLGTTEADKYCRQAEKERMSELVFTSSSNENHAQNHHSEDRILEVMLQHSDLKLMFEKIINQPKDTNLIQTFGLTA